MNTQLPENQSLPDYKSNYVREKNMVDVLDNCDATVIHMGNNNKVPLVHSDNVDDNISTINISSNFTISPFDYKCSVMAVT